MQSQNFRDKEILAMTPDMAGVTRPKKDKKTKKFTFIVKGVGIGTAPMKYLHKQNHKLKLLNILGLDGKIVVTN